MRNRAPSEGRATFSWQFRRAFALGATLLAFLSFGCSPPTEQSGPEAVTEEDKLIVCNEPTSAQDREFYVLDAIRRKLAYYPDLAAHAGLTEVKTCEEGRAFRTAYYEFAAQNPEFDRDQPLGDLPEARR
jgi:hypothetical protein